MYHTPDITQWLPQISASFKSPAHNSSSSGIICGNLSFKIRTIFRFVTHSRTWSAHGDLAAMKKLCVKSVGTPPPRDNVRILEVGILKFFRALFLPPSHHSRCPGFQNDNAAASGWWLYILQYEVLAHQSNCAVIFELPFSWTSTIVTPSPLCASDSVASIIVSCKVNLTAVS